jgi:hypothetical protein
MIVNEHWYDDRKTRCEQVDRQVEPSVLSWLVLVWIQWQGNIEIDQAKNDSYEPNEPNSGKCGFEISQILIAADLRLHFWACEDGPGAVLS